MPEPTRGDAPWLSLPLPSCRDRNLKRPYRHHAYIQWMAGYDGRGRRGDMGHAQQAAGSYTCCLCCLHMSSYGMPAVLFVPWSRTANVSARCSCLDTSRPLTSWPLDLWASSALTLATDGQRHGYARYTSAANLQAQRLNKGRNTGSGEGVSAFEWMLHRGACKELRPGWGCAVTKP